MKFVVSLVLLVISVSLFAQRDNLVSMAIKPASNDTVHLPHFPVLISSVSIPGFIVEKDYQILGNSLLWKASDTPDSVLLTYRFLVFPMKFSHKNDSIIQRSFEDNPFAYVPSKNTSTKADFGNVQSVGNISRGIGFGNAQDVVVNSNLNLSLSGKLPNDIELIAVISDENNPIQPEGNTQELQDFDQVYIALKKDSTKLVVGDFLMNNAANTYFMKYNKRSRGLQLSTQQKLGKGVLISGAEAALSRGRFSRNTIASIEGNNGPYRLSGQNGEQFLILIAGTEVVYLDGKKLQRGEDNDYVINYNTGEVTFTPRILITRYSRIVVEFQYSDRNYARTVSTLSTQYVTKKNAIYAHFFNEMDLKNQPFQQEFDSIRLGDVLGNVGDEKAFIERSRAISQFNVARPMYLKKSLGNVEYFEYTSAQDSSFQYFEVSFSNVGFGNGDYSILQSAANGRVYQFVGSGAGDYLPVEVVIAPERHNFLVLGSGMNLGNRRNLQVELAISGKDKNTFSDLQNDDNQGFGFKTIYTDSNMLKDSSRYKLATTLDYEMVSENFSFVERYRNVEFDRSWNKVLENPNALSASVKSMEHIGNLGLKLYQSDHKFLRNTSSFFQRPEVFSGWKNSTDAQWQLKKWRSAGAFEYLRTNTILDSHSQQNAFQGINLSLERPTIFGILGGAYQAEQSVFSINNDSLVANSYRFSQSQLSLRNADTSKLKYGVMAVQRSDALPKNGIFNEATLGRHITANAGFVSKKQNRVSLDATYRTLSVLDTTLSSKNLENTFQSRLELDYNFFKKLISLRTFYEVGTGQEQRREFQYLEVAAGNGIYVWNDYNKDGVRTLDEFEVASSLDRPRANFIRVFVPVSGFFTTGINKLSQSMNINPAATIKQSNPNQYLKFLAKFNSLTTFASEKKSLPGEVFDLLNPLVKTQQDANLINQKQNIRTTLFFNRTNPKYGLDYSYISNQNKILLSNGFESRMVQEQLVNSRINAAKTITILTKFGWGRRGYESEFFKDRSFLYDFLSLSPEISYQYKNSMRLAILYDFFNAANGSAYGTEQSLSHKYGMTIKYTKPEKGTLDLGFNFVNVAYNGALNSTLAYDLLNGLQAGRNFTWVVNYQQRIASNIQVTASYDGRKTPEAPFLHIGRLVARYLF